MYSTNFNIRLKFTYVNDFYFLRPLVPTYTYINIHKYISFCFFVFISAHLFCRANGLAMALTICISFAIVPYNLILFDIWRGVETLSLLLKWHWHLSVFLSMCGRTSSGRRHMKFRMQTLCTGFQREVTDPQSIFLLLVT